MKKMYEARTFFMDCLLADAPFVAVENPVPLKVANLPKPTCFVDPSWFGSRYTKKTLYWLNHLPPLVGQLFNPGASSLCAHRKGKYRSRTIPELAAAVAAQWGEYVQLQMSDYVWL
jgi:hypothetical protein